MAIQARKMTATEFLTLPESNLPHELINGEEIMSPAPTTEHQRVVRKLSKLLDTLIPNGEIFFAPIDLYIDEDNVVQPDLLWISAENTEAIIEKNFVRGAPDLVIEVFSPGTVRRDRREKFHLYEKAGVREYWMLDVDEKLLEIWQLQDGRFMLVDVFGVEDECKSPLLGKVE